jgi:hypothetical protein
MIEYNSFIIEYNKFIEFIKFIEFNKFNVII